MTLAASTLDGPIDVDELLHLICLAAIDTVPGAEYAGITLADRHGKLETPAEPTFLSTGLTRCNTSSTRARALTPSRDGGRPARTT
jgi:hypothetical protein